MPIKEPAAKIPLHVAIIMDGNRRWARQHKLEVLQGHAYVANKVIEPLVDRCLELGIKYLTLWAFSTENWRRDAEEVNGLMSLFREAFQKSGELLDQKGIRLNAIGNLHRFPVDIQKGIEAWQERTRAHTNMTVTFALNYGGRDEIVRAVQKLLVEKGSLGETDVTAENITAHLDTADMPNPDLIIRPGGEQRLSGYLLWQSEYAELYFTDVLMPDFTPAELDKAVAEYGKRSRRFGK